MKYLGLIFLFLIVGGFVMAENVFKIENVKRDIPSVLEPNFVKHVEACGKIDLIDRASINYNSKALVDGSLKDC